MNIFIAKRTEKEKRKKEITERKNERKTEINGGRTDQRQENKEIKERKKCILGRVCDRE
jgi:hypothetical protein